MPAPQQKPACTASPCMRACRVSSSASQVFSQCARRRTCTTWPRLAYASCWQYQCRRRAASHVCVPAPRRRKPPASLLHNAAFCKVSASRCAKASLGVRHRFAPFGFAKQALCKVACASGASSLPATGYGRGVPRPPRPRLPGLPRGVPALFLSQCASRRWPLRGLLSPAHPGAGPWGGRLGARPPPRGLPPPRRGGVGLWRALCLFVAPKVSARFASPRKPHPKELERVPQSCLAVKAASRRLRGGLRPALTASHLCCVLLS